jgi:alginate O-acetyltransferase complex protein AlgI
MVFTEARFFVFFAVVFLIYWSLPTNRQRKLFLLLASYTFYAAWDWRFLSLLVLSTGADFIAGLYLDRAKSEGRRQAVMWASVILGLTILGVFKYFGFFAAEFARLFASAGVSVSVTTLEFVLPVGISFYTFQTMSYVIDVYRRRIAACSDPFDFALYVAFFPQLVAGPIVRAHEFLPQLERSRRFGEIDLRLCVLLCLVGFFKKAVVADNTALLIDPIWSNPAAYDWISIILAEIFFPLQLYCDFSGYADIAVGTAGLLGYHLPRNFAAPFLAASVADFWRRWNISLSFWFRDYVFAPLFKMRIGTEISIVITMGLVGLWHGANWTFIIWGLVQGVALAALVARKRFNLFPSIDRMPELLGVLLTFSFFALCGALFRSADLPTAFEALKITFLGSAGTRSVDEPDIMIILFIVLVGTHYLWNRFDLEKRISNGSEGALAVGYGVAFALCFSLMPRALQPFIYFQF